MHRFTALAYGVMVAHQILVLPVKVRVPVRQQTFGFSSEGFFLILFPIFTSMTRLFGFLICIALFVACTDPVSDNIADYEFTRHKIKISNIENIGTSTPLTAYDSLDICQKMFYERKKHLIDIQNQFIDTLDIQIASANAKIEKENNPTMMKALNHALASLNYKRKIAQQVVDSYKNAPENTSLNIYLSLIDKYEALGDTILAYTMQCSFTGKQGLLPEETFTRTYLLSQDKRTIIGEFVKQ